MKSFFGPQKTLPWRPIFAGFIHKTVAQPGGLTLGSALHLVFTFSQQSTVRRLDHLSRLNMHSMVRIICSPNQPTIGSAVFATYRYTSTETTERATSVAIGRINAMHELPIECKDPRVQPPLSSKFAVKKSLISSIRASLSCLYWVSIAGTGELDMNLTSWKVGIHRHCSINKLN